jgi:hypothetical protein
MDKLKIDPMKQVRLALCGALVSVLAACAAPPPSGPSVAVLAGPKISDEKFARDDSACRARAETSVRQAAAVAGQFGVQGQYDSVYSDCMLPRGYEVSERAPRLAYGPGVHFYGPGPYYLGPVGVYSWGVSAGF